MDIEKIKNSIRNIPDFPKKGIQFKDITTLLKDHKAFNNSIEIFYNEFVSQNVDVVVGIESRGFIFAAPLSLRLGAQLVIARKPNKLPGEKISQPSTINVESSGAVAMVSFRVDINSIILSFPPSLGPMLRIK